MISVKALHGPDAWRYLMESVTDGQGDLRHTDAITRYYTELAPHLGAGSARDWPAGPAASASRPDRSCRASR